MIPDIIVVRRSSQQNPFANLKKTMGNRAAYVGVPASSAADRRKALANLAGKATGKKKACITAAAGSDDINNASLLFIHTKGSIARNIPARPVLEPAVEAEGNKEAIGAELAAASKAAMQGDQAGTDRGLKRAAMAGQNAARGWFTNPENGWAPNSQRTIKRKRSDRPLIDTGALRASIIGLVK